LPPRILTAEEKREAELKVSREKSAREREEYQRWQMEQEELKTKAIPMPDSVKDLLQRVRKR